MKKLRNALVALTLMLGVSGAVMVPTVSAVNVFEGCSADPENPVCKAESEDEASSMVVNVINILLYIIGIIAVVMIIIGGVRYTVSNGNSSQLKEAKDTIIYAVVGLVVAMVAYGIVNLVVIAFLPK